MQSLSRTVCRYCRLIAAFALALLVGLWGGLPAAGAAPKRIILIETMPVPVVRQHSRWFLTQLRELGYRENETMTLIRLEPDGDRARAKVLLRGALVEGRPDLVVTNATMASQVAMQVLAGTGIPMLFMTVSDPVGAGLIRQIGVPTGTQITGKVHMIDRATRINMVMELVGQTISRRPVRLGFIHSSYPSARGDIRELQALAANREDITFVVHELPYRRVPDGMPAMLTDVTTAIQILEGRVDAWWEPSGPLGEVEAYTRLLQQHSSAAIAMGTKLHSVRLGALLHLTPNVEATGREAALLADAILKGADPGKIAPSPPTAFDLGINLGTALKMNIVVGPDIIKLAGEHVYR